MLHINSRSAFGLAAMLGIASAVLAPSAQAAPARGTLLTSNFLTSYTRDAISAMLASGSRPASGSQPEQAKCNVRVAEFTYATIGVEGEPATASGVLLIPGGERCSGPYPLLGWGIRPKRCALRSRLRRSAMRRATTRWLRGSPARGMSSSAAIIWGLVNPIMRIIRTCTARARRVRPSMRCARRAAFCSI